MQIYDMGVGHKNGKFKLIIDKKFSQGGSKIDFNNNDYENKINEEYLGEGFFYRFFMLQ